MNILFVDSVCPKPYSGSTLRQEAMGGSEATLVKISEKLAEKHNITVLQHNRTEELEDEGVHYTNTLPDKAHYVIVFRSVVPIPALRAKYPDAKIYLWMQDVCTRTTSDHVNLLRAMRVGVLGVSQWHRMQIIEQFKTNPDFEGGVPIDYIYNPVYDHIKHDHSPILANKLLFASAPIKGLKETLEVFRNLKNFVEVKDSQLYILNPGYMPDMDVKGIPNVHVLGALPQHEVIKHMRDSLCLFHINPVFPETFGIVYAEAQAVGLPFIAHNFSAIREISDHPKQMVDCRDPKKVIDTLISMRSGARPTVRLAPQFRLANVIKRWNAIFKE